MGSENNKKTFAELNKVLGGTSGIVYLMFVGRETYANQIHGFLVGTIYSHTANVNQTMSRLRKHGSKFLIFERRQREKGARGREAQFYRANLEPIFATLRSFCIDFDEAELQFVLESLSEVNDLFPRYLLNIFQPSVLRTFSWNTILALYFSYVSEYLRPNGLVVFPTPQNAAIDREKIAFLCKSHPNTRKKLFEATIQLSSPNLMWNPQFKKYIFHIMNQLETFESDAKSFLRFFQELRKIGVTDLERYYSELIEQLKEMENLKKRLKKADALLAKVEKIEKQAKTD